MWTGAATVALIAVLFLVGPYTFLPSLVGNIIARNIQEDLSLAETPSVELTSDEPLQMLGGEFSGGRVEMRDAEFGGLRTERVVLDLDPFDIDVRSSLINRALQGEDLGGDLRVEIPEDEVSRLAQSRAPVPIDRVGLSQDEMLVETRVAILGGEVPVAVRGDVDFENREISFLPGEIEIAGATLPQENAESLLGDLEVSFEVEGFPESVDLNDVSTGEGEIVLTGRMEGLPSGGLSQSG